MRKTRDVLRLYFELKLGQRQIARSANLSQSTVHDYLERFRATGLTLPLPAGMSEAELEWKGWTCCRCQSRVQDLSSCMFKLNTDHRQHDFIARL